MIDFSIVIPVYNVEKYIMPCVESVLSQSHGNLEAILIDDASTDGSGAICDGLSIRDSRVRVIHLEKNSYVGAARNAGLRLCRGEYVYFLDSDDELRRGVLEYVYSIITSAEEKPQVVTSFTHCTKKPNGKLRAHTLKKLSLPLTTQINVFSPFLGQSFYLRSFLEVNARPFDEHRMLAEDRKWLMENICSAKKIAVAEGPFYYYTMRRDGSLLNLIKADSLEYSLGEVKRLFDNLSSFGYPSSAALKRKIADHYLTLASCCAIVRDRALRRKLMACVKNDIYILKDKACLAHGFMWLRHFTGLTLLLKLCNKIFLRYRTDK